LGKKKLNAIFCSAKLLRIFMTLKCSRSGDLLNRPPHSFYVNTKFKEHKISFLMMSSSLL